MDVLQDSLDQTNADYLLRLASSHESDIDLLLLFYRVLENHGQNFLEGFSEWSGLRLLQNSLYERLVSQQTLDNGEELASDALNPIVLAKLVLPSCCANHFIIDY